MPMAVLLYAKFSLDSCHFFRKEMKLLMACEPEKRTIEL